MPNLKYCTKCGKPDSTFDDKFYGHKYCVHCGALYGYSETKVELAENLPTYQKILDMHEQFNDYFKKTTTAEYKYLDNLFSNSAREVMFLTANLAINNVSNDNNGNPIIKGLIEASKMSLRTLYFNVIVDGYFAWVVENKLDVNIIKKLNITNLDLFSDECFLLKNLIYDDFIKFLKGSRDSKYISAEMSRIFLTLSTFRGHSYFNNIKELKPLEEIYDSIQMNFAESIVAGYAVAIIDAKYRNQI